MRKQKLICRLLNNMRNFLQDKFFSWARDKRALTIVEVLVAMAIFVMMITGIVAVLLWGMRGKDIVWEQLITQNEGRKVAQDFINELRRAAASSIGAYPLEKAAAQEIIFYSDIDSDTWRERIRYFLSDTTLKKGIIKPAGTPLQYASSTETITDIVHDVANDEDPLFYYYDEDYTGATGTPLTYPLDITAVRVAQISLKLEENPRASPAPFHIEAKTAIRNLKDN